MGFDILGVYFVISIVTFSLVALWVSYSKPTIEIHSQCPFRFLAQSGIRRILYYLEP